MRKYSKKFSEFVRTGKEIRELLEHANAYLNGEGSIISLHGHAANARDAVTYPVLVEWLDEWIFMTNRAWNEFGTSVAPISEDELKAWVAKQLSQTYKFSHSN